MAGFDTDSDNDGYVDRSSAEDALEDVAGSGIDEVGKRIFVNKDDDNENGVADTEDDDDDLPATSTQADANKVTLQSHWGSGVVFTDVSITED